MRWKLTLGLFGISGFWMAFPQVNHPTSGTISGVPELIHVTSVPGSTSAGIEEAITAHCPVHSSSRHCNKVFQLPCGRIEITDRIDLGSNYDIDDDDQAVHGLRLYGCGGGTAASNDAGLCGTTIVYKGTGALLDGMIRVAGLSESDIGHFCLEADDDGFSGDADTADAGACINIAPSILQNSAVLRNRFHHITCIQPEVRGINIQSAGQPMLFEAGLTDTIDIDDTTTISSVVLDFEREGFMATQVVTLAGFVEGNGDQTITGVTGGSPSTMTFSGTPFPGGAASGSGDETVAVNGDWDDQQMESNVFENIYIREFDEVGFYVDNSNTQSMALRDSYFQNPEVVGSKVIHMIEGFLTIDNMVVIKGSTGAEMTTAIHVGGGTDHFVMMNSNQELGDATTNHILVDATGPLNVIVRDNQFNLTGGGAEADYDCLNWQSRGHLEFTGNRCYTLGTGDLDDPHLNLAPTQTAGDVTTFVYTPPISEGDALNAYDVDLTDAGNVMRAMNLGALTELDTLTDTHQVTWDGTDTRFDLEAP